MVVLGFTFTRPLTVVAGLVSADKPWSTLTAESITSSSPLVAEGLALVTEVDDELLVELLADALAEVSIFVDDSANDDSPVEEGFEVPFEGTTAELIGSSAEVDEVLELVTTELVVELVAVEPVDKASEPSTEVDVVLLVAG